MDSIFPVIMLCHVIFSGICQVSMSLCTCILFSLCFTAQRETLKCPFMSCIWQECKAKTCIHTLAVASGLCYCLSSQYVCLVKWKKPPIGIKVDYLIGTTYAMRK